jgi:hypothetical protein
MSTIEREGERHAREVREKALANQRPPKPPAEPRQASEGEIQWLKMREAERASRKPPKA